MMEINLDRRVDVNKVCNKHFDFVEPKVISKVKDYLEPANLNIVQSSCNFPITIAEITSFLHWVKTHVRKILKGKPDELNTKHEEVKSLHPNVYGILLEERKLNKNSRVITNMINNIFDYSTLSEEKLRVFYDLECEELKSLDLFKCTSTINKESEMNNFKEDIIRDIDSRFDSKDFYIAQQINLLKDGIRSISVRNAGQIIRVSDFRKQIKTLIDQCINKLKDKDALSMSNYKQFIKKYPDTWSAYHLVMELGLKVCPYCNRSYIYPYYSKDSKTRADLDHFFPKSLYPYFSISFYNLIPSCKVCNSSFKGSEDFKFDNFLSPYEGGFNDDVVFTYQINNVSSFTDSEYLELQLVPKAGINRDRLSKINGNIKMLALEPMYNYHRDIVIEMIIKRKVYSQAWIDDIFKLYKYNRSTGEGFFKSKQEVVEMVFSNYLIPDKTDKRVLAKLTRDIAKELKFI